MTINHIISVNNGFVRLDNHMADDLSVINAARVSFARSSSVIDESGRGLIAFLMRERHGTPFEHNAFRFHVKCPIFVAREWFRHRIGSFNEFSARYAEVEDDFYVPLEHEVRTQVGKPGAYKFEPVDPSTSSRTVSILKDIQGQAYAAYEDLLSHGVAKEVARMVLPVSTYTQFYWTVNARALMNFLSLRNHNSAQYEIREFAKAVEEFFSEAMPLTYVSWVNSGRIAP